ERVRLVAAPGRLRDVELEVLGWRTEAGEVALTCRLSDGSAGTIPARWTDLPRTAAVERTLGVIATPAAWRAMDERLAALRERRLELGWPAQAVAVVDGDQGRSGSSAEGRLGFKELVGEVGLGQVGIVLALEVSRLARSSADWHQLLDLCALTGTLIADG